jgi:2-methylcitrate dehydratase PrpD
MAIPRRSIAVLDIADTSRAGELAALIRVCTSTTDERMADMPFAPDDRVSVVLRTGKTLAHAPVTRPKGSWQKPLSENELHEKFMDCAGTGMPEAKAASLFEAAWCS